MPRTELLRRSSLDCAAHIARHSSADLTAPLTPPTAPMIGPAIQLRVLRADLEGQNAAVVQACVPLVDITGDSYRMRAHRDAINALRPAITGGEFS
jgi:hypothetical protein